MKPEVDVPSEPATPFLGTYQRNGEQKPMQIAALLTIAKRGRMGKQAVVSSVQ